MLPAIVILGSRVRARSSYPALGAMAVAIALLLPLFSCSGISKGAITGSGGTSNPVTYQIRITGTSPGAANDAGQSTVVTLIVE
jgi:hypothetical protein